MQASRIATVIGVAVIVLVAIVGAVALGITSREGRLGHSFARVGLGSADQGSPTPQASALRAAITPTPLATPVPLPTIYRVGGVLRRDNVWLLTLDDLQVLPNGDLRAEVTYQNETASMQTVSCSADNDDGQIYLTLSNGTQVVPASTFCGANRGKVFALASGDTLHSWANFALPHDGALVSLTWYGWGSVDSLPIVAR